MGEMPFHVSQNTTMWSDIQPVEVDISTNLGKINLANDARRAFALFRGVQAVSELSARALQLTDEVIHFNSADYTAWYYRRRCLLALNSDLLEELEYVRTWTLESTKNYQVWYHRRWILEQLNDSCDELSSIEPILDDESKNYNAWAHRTWLVRRFRLPLQPEMLFSLRMIQRDFQNNSAWVYRHFLLERLLEESGSSTPSPSFPGLASEIELALSWIRAEPSNESVYRYLMGVLHLCDRSEFLSAVAGGGPLMETISEFAVDTLDGRFALETLAEIQLVRGQVDCSKQVFRLLQKVDPIRRFYWNWRAAQDDPSSGYFASHKGTTLQANLNDK
eukprot:GHVT01069430.1.p1 GENE.GHVT01069430.1~~GHVT01069430.1.p1  ORF type:complete len:334 (-),score=30.15 GHVT01069430.1:234-1235(-)